MRFELITTRNGLRGIAARIEAISAVEIAAAVAEDYKENIEQSKNIDGSKMRDISKGWRNEKRRQGRPTIPLVYTSQLIQAVRHSGNRNSAKVYIVPSRKGGRVTNREILDFQEKARRYPWGISRKLLTRLRQRYKLQSGN